MLCSVRTLEPAAAPADAPRALLQPAGALPLLQPGILAPWHDLCGAASRLQGARCDLPACLPPRPPARLLQEYQLPPGSFPHFVSLSPDERLAFVSTYFLEEGAKGLLHLQGGQNASGVQTGAGMWAVAGAGALVRGAGQAPGGSVPTGRTALKHCAAAAGQEVSGIDASGLPRDSRSCTNSLVAPIHPTARPSCPPARSRLRRHPPGAPV